MLRARTTGQRIPIRRVAGRFASHNHADQADIIGRQSFRLFRPRGLSAAPLAITPMATPTPLKPEDEARIPLHLINEIREGNAALFIGSGLSVPLGYPSWKNLVRTIHQNLEATKVGVIEADRKWIEASFASQPDWVAEAIEHGSHDAYAASLRRIFAPRRTVEASFNHTFAALLPFDKYLTTNYDTLLETYIEAFIDPGLPVYSHTDAMTNYWEYVGARRSILKLHGCAKKNSDSLILTSSQYYAVLKDERYTRLLSHLFSSRTILAIGFSLRDRDFRTFLEERYHLYQRRCPPFYAAIPSDETCKLEMDVLSSRYNVTVLPISRENNFEELTAFLYSLYCLVYREDSSAVGSRIAGLAALRVRQKGLCSTADLISSPPQLSRALDLLACFQDPLPLDLFISFVMENGVQVSAAEVLTSVTQDSLGRIRRESTSPPNGSDAQIVAKWIANELTSLPVPSARRHFTTYQKGVFHRYQDTLVSLLATPDGWAHLIGHDADSQHRLVRLNQFFRQEGLWGKWLDVAKIAKEFVNPADPTYRQLLQSILWVYFWTRRFSEVESLLAECPDLDDSSGEHNYSDRIKYTDREHLEKLVSELESRSGLDYFAMSLLGRSHAQLSLSSAIPGGNLSDAKHWLSLAKAGATSQGDWIERAVQSWYLAIVLAEQGELDQARQELAEVRRLDEAIMNRAPGIAWLHLAEYRLAVRDARLSRFRISELRENALQAFRRLGTVDPDHYIDHEYFY